MLKKPNGKHLNEHQRCEIISKLSKTNAPSKRALAQEYIVSEGDVNTQVLTFGLENGVIFHGFYSLYKHVLDIEDYLLCLEVQAEAEEAFDDLKKSFESFQSKIRVVGLKAKRKNFKTYAK